MFFFSSRRRHTRLQGDWSSDVCSSDLYRRRLLAGQPLALGVLDAAARAARWEQPAPAGLHRAMTDRKSTRLNSSHLVISYAVFCLKKKKTQTTAGLYLYTL